MYMILLYREKLLQEKNLGLDMDVYNCMSEGVVVEDLVSSEQWCICNSCMDRVEKVVNKLVNR